MIVQKNTKGGQRGQELNVRGGCEMRGVNSQGWMVESRERKDEGQAELQNHCQNYLVKS